MKRQSLLYTLLGGLFCLMSTFADAANPYMNYNECALSTFCDGKITVGADWLYWKVTEDNLSVGSIATETLTDDTLPLEVQGSYLNQNFKWESGFRLNLGYELPCGCWGIDVIYTYMPGHSQSPTFTTTDLAFNQFNPDLVDFPILSIFNPNGRLLPPTTVRAKWNLAANNIDVDLARTVCFGDCLKLRPHIGFRTTWFNQKLRYTAFTIIPTTPLQQSFFAKFSEKFTGCGVEGGLWGEWDVGGCGLSVIGHFGGSILYSKFRVHQRAIAANETVLPGVLTDVGGSATLHHATPTLDYFLGLQYDASLWDLSFAMHAGWEQHILFDVNKLARDGNLSAQGLTLGLELGF